MSLFFFNSLLPSKVWGAGYQAPDTPKFSLAQNINIGEGGENLPEEVELPLQLILEADIIATHVTNQTTQAITVVNNEPLESVLLYDPKSTNYQEAGLHPQGFISQLCLRLEGSGQFVPQLSSPPLPLFYLKGFMTRNLVGQEIFVKDFTIQNTSVIKQAYQKTERGWAITPPGFEQGLPLWGYAGYYRPGCDLREIAQVFFMLYRQDFTTTVRLSTKKFWQEMGVSYPLGGSFKEQKVVFMDSSVSFTSLAEDIEKGAVKINLNLEHSLKPIVYRSFGYKVKESNRLALYFLPDEF